MSTVRLLFITVSHQGQKDDLRGLFRSSPSLYKDPNNYERLKCPAHFEPFLQLLCPVSTKRKIHGDKFSVSPSLYKGLIQRG